MSHKNLLTPITVAALLVAGFVIGLTPFGGPPLKEFLIGVFVLTLYGLLVGGYLLAWLVSTRVYPLSIKCSGSA